MPPDSLDFVIFKPYRRVSRQPLSARKELGGELNVHSGADGSAEQNIALHKAVMQKLAENGGKVPASMKG